MERTPAGNAVSLYYFADAMPGAATPRLAAAVVWRSAPHDPRAGTRRRGRGPMGWLRRLRHRLWLRLGPLGLDVQWGGIREHAREGLAVRSVGLPADPEPRAYYDGRTVRLLDRVYDVPADGRTLVVLVNEGGMGDTSGHWAARDAVRTVHIPSAPAGESARRDPASQHSAPGRETTDARIDILTSGGRPEWDAALRANPEVRAFLDADPWA